MKVAQSLKILEFEGKYIFSENNYGYYDILLKVQINIPTNCQQI